jgi:hypothetical protein
VRGGTGAGKEGFPVKEAIIFKASEDQEVRFDEDMKETYLKKL